MKTRSRNIAIGIFATLAVGGITWLIIWLVNRPENIDIVSASQDATTTPSLVKFAVNDEKGLTVRIDETKFVSNNTRASYLLTVEGLPANQPGSDDDLGLHLTETTNFTRFSALGSVVSVVYDDNLQFPHELPASFDPQEFQGFAVTDGSTDGATGELTIIKTASFSSSGGSSSTEQDGSGCAPSLPLLSAAMNGRRGYDVGGTISIEYREDLVDGEVVFKPVLKMTDVTVPSAPGPFLYLSKRPASSGTWDGDEDIFIPIDGVEEGSFTKAGTFTQDLDEIMDVSMLEKYAGGSFIVWCRPFSVYLGGGQIEKTSVVSVSNASTKCPEEDSSTPEMNPPQDSDLPMLSAEMSGAAGYNVGGTFTITYRQDLVNNQVKQIPVLTLMNTEVPSAPGPFLYLSKRSKVVGEFDSNEDIEIPIDGADGGSFTKEGTFSQDLDEIMDPKMIKEYANGSFIVWCKPFSVYMGGGQIKEV